MTKEILKKYVLSGQRIFMHGVAANPQYLGSVLNEVILEQDLKNIEIVTLCPFGKVAYTQAAMEGNVFINSLFVSEPIRKVIQEGRGSYVPVFLSEIPELFSYGILPIDLAIFQVSPPDQHGFCTLGVSVDIAITALKMAKICIAQINPRMPRTHGDGFVHISKFAETIEYQEELPEILSSEPTEIERKIGEFCASLVEDGATLQMGIGGIPNAALACLNNHKNLGIHTEMFSDGVISLVEKGVVNGIYKNKHPQKVVAGFVIGSRKVYDFIHDNPSVVLLDSNYVNDDAVIRTNPKVVAINSAIEIDLLGQVCADTIGMRQFSGIGGQMDFIRGASLSPGGKPIIALPSTTNKGVSRIVPLLNPGASVTTTRAHVHYVVTEYGIAQLFGKNIQQRIKALIEIAHPLHRESLEKAAHERLNS